jgi:hypothetical protein
VVQSLSKFTTFLSNECNIERVSRSSEKSDESKENCLFVYPMKMNDWFRISSARDIMKCWRWNTVPFITLALCLIKRRTRGLQIKHSTPNCQSQEWDFHRSYTELVSPYPRISLIGDSIGWFQARVNLSTSLAGKWAWFGAVWRLWCTLHLSDHNWSYLWSVSLICF